MLITERTNKYREKGTGGKRNTKEMEVKRRNS